MQALDTNILVRAIVRDDVAQAALADAALRRRCFVPITVTLETVWVLRSRYKFARDTVVRALGVLMRGEGLHFSHHEEIAWALGRFAEGADFADMLHVALSKASARFVTLDRDLARHASGAAVPIETLTA